MKVLCLHGIGHEETTSAIWQPLWTDAIPSGLHAVNPGAAGPSVAFLDYDDFFDDPLAHLSYIDFARASWSLLRGAFARPCGLLDFSDSTRWHAGMVVVWVNDPDLREQLRQHLSEALDRVKPDLICAHSLGSLIAYDTLVRAPDLVRGKTLLTFGSQIGNLFIRGSAFAERVEPLQAAAQWFHLYNPNDHVFTAPLDFGAFQTAGNFRQVVTPFGNYVSGFADNHNAVNPKDPDAAYLTHPQTAAVVWPQIGGGPAVRALAIPARAAGALAP